MKFDWSNDSTSVQWAAFYSDCEHEVLPVTDGYRVTITYNLLYTSFQLNQSPNWKGPFPLLDDLAKALQSKRFMSNGINPLREALLTSRRCSWSVLSSQICSRI